MDNASDLERARPLLEGLFAATPARIVLFDPEGAVRFRNAAALAAWPDCGGRPSGSPPWDSRLGERVDDVFRTGQFRRTDLTWCSPEGIPEPFHALLIPLGEASGNPLAVLALFEPARPDRATGGPPSPSEEKFERAFRLTPDAMAINRLSDGRYLDVNDAFQRITGYSKAELVGRSSLELGIWADPADRERLVEVLRTQRSVHELEACFRKKDGSLIQGLMSGNLIEIAGEPCILNVTVDITERKRMEAILRESENRYRQLVEQAADGIFQGAPDGTVIAVNPKGCELTGYSAEELLGANLRVLFSGEELERMKFRYDLLDEGRTVISERWLTRKDGSRLPVEMNSRRMEDGTYLSFFRDISARLEAEQRLQREEALLAAIIDANPYAIQLVDDQGRHLRHNQAFLDLFGALPPPGYCIFEDPILQRAGMVPRLREALQGRRVMVPDLWYDPHEVSPEVPSQRRCLRSALFPLKEPDGRISNLVVMHEDVTDWKLAEEALRRQEEQYRNLFFTMAQGVVYQDSEGHVISANPAAERILGLSFDQMVGRSTLDPRWRCIREDGSPFPGEDHPAMVALRTGLPVNGVVMGIFVEGQGVYRWAVVNATPEFLPGEPRPWRVFATFTDITELKAAQDAHRTMAARLRGVLNNSQAVIFQIDPEGRFLLSEGRGLASLDILPGQVVGLSALDMYRDSPTVLHALRKALAGEACRAALEVRGMVFDTTLSPVFDGEGRLESVIGVSTNITDRVRVEQALRESEGKFRDLLEKLGEGYALVDSEETFTFVNPAAEAIFGVAPGQLVGRNLLEFLPPEEEQRVLDQTRRRKTGEKGVYELTIRRPNQEIRQLLINVVPMRDAAGNYLGANGIMQDVTERRQAEEALRQAQKLESLGVLAGGIAHDFNNLLTAILGNLNLAQASMPPGSPLAPHLENVEKSVLRAADLTKQMLAYSGRGRFIVKRHDLNQVVSEMGTLLRVTIPKKTELMFRLSPGALPIEADAAQIHQVVMNLVTNAADAIGEAPGVITLATRVDRLALGQIPSANPGQMLPEGTYAVLEVVDSGCGISPDVRERLFDPFFTTKASGRGLGLSAMLGILRAHHGGIQIQSQVGLGSTFTLFLPLVPGSAGEAAAPTPPAEGRFTGVALVADDEPTVLEFVSLALGRLGFRTITARDGLEAVDQFSKDPAGYDLVLLDLTMPRLDGREALHEIRHLRPEVPVILSSGFSDREFLGAGESDPDLVFLPKPYQLKDLKRAIEKVLRQPMG